jgi:hypothetical protein
VGGEVLFALCRQTTATAERALVLASHSQVAANAVEQSQTTALALK